MSGPSTGQPPPGLPSFSLDGKVALVTGAGRGIGMACSLALAEAGADLVLVSRTLDELEALAERVRGLGRRATTVVCDVTGAQEVETAIEPLERIDIVVCSAGTNIPEPFADVSEDHLDAVLDVNVKGTFLAAQAAVRNMLARQSGGSIVLISSQMGHVGAPNRTVYCMTKHAVEGLTKAMAVELAPRGIRVNAVGPTFINTPMTKPFFENAEFKADVLSRIPMGRIGELEDVVGAVVFLASPAAGLITGASLVVDGGWTAR
jgi:NAD(P)-dependent dehydrogenase (short-subunit alcohol dehydrogenase family)